MTTVEAGQAQAKPARTRTSAGAGRWHLAAWDSPTTSYYLVGAAGALLLALGLVMVLSASTVYSLRDSGGATPFTGFLSQARYALMAVPVAFIASRMRPHWFKRLSWLAIAAAGALALLPVLVPSMRRGAGGNAGWVSIGGQSLQPSEFAKLALAIWLGSVLAAKGPLLKSWIHVLFPAVIGAGLFVAIVLAGHDLGTAMMLILLIFGALWVAGVPMIVFSVGRTLAAGAVAFLATVGNRADRILAFLGMAEVDPLAGGLQPQRALEGLGSGGLSGVGLGASAEKWLYLPAAENDFIFAIIGEELGLLGTLLVLGLFVALAVGFTRIIKRHPDPFVKIATGAIATWIIGQALVNIGVVIGLLPVLGVPLPFVSAGGSSLIATTIALGIVLCFARSEPGAPEALAARKAAVRRSLAVLAPRRRARD